MQNASVKCLYLLQITSHFGSYLNIKLIQLGVHLSLKVVLSGVAGQRMYRLV